jgi:hypothetical protein
VGDGSYISAWSPIVPEYVKYVADHYRHRWQNSHMFYVWKSGIRAAFTATLLPYRRG